MVATESLLAQSYHRAVAPLPLHRATDALVEDPDSPPPGRFFSGMKVIGRESAAALLCHSRIAPSNQISAAVDHKISD
jgi:hypothetical protein